MKGEIACSELTRKKAASLRRLAVVAMVIAAAGCTSLVAGCSTPSKAPGASPHARAFVPRVDRRYVRPKVKNGVLIMPFFDHNFGSYCFDTLKCRVLYQNLYTTNQHERSGSRADYAGGDLSGGWVLDDRPSIARVSWTSRDGVNHDESIDLEKIFRSRLVLYTPELDVSDVNLAVYYTSPDIIVVVDDRSISVVMKAVMPMLHLVDPSNRYSNIREQSVVAYTHEF